MSKEKGFIAIIPMVIILCLLTGAAGFYLGRNSVKTQAKTQKSSENSIPQSVVSEQSVTLKGIITDAAGNTITLKNNQGNNSAVLMLAPSFAIITIPSKPGPSSQVITSLTANIPKGKQVIVNAVMDKNQKYEVTSIAVVGGSAPVSASPSAITNTVSSKK